MKAKMLQSLDILKKLLELRRKVLKPRDFRGRLNYLQRHRREKGNVGLDLEWT